MRWLAVIGCGIGLLAGCGGSPAVAPQQKAAAAFLASYARPGGQVIRRDQGDDTVSEGQSYGMLLAEVAGDPGAFRQIWDWTRRHLQLSDGLFAAQASAAGQVVSDQSASDADLLIAWALLRYRGPGEAARHRDGRRVADAVLAREVTPGPGGRPVLAAGPWATGRPASLDPSYWSLPALQGLARLTGRAQWRRLAAEAVSLTRSLTRDGRLLPSDWAELTAAGSLRPEPAPNGSQPQTQYGLDAQRAVAWFAASCDPQARALAARWWPLLRAGHRVQALALQPDGTVLDGLSGALPLVASAAAAQAAGDGRAAGQLLRHAGQVQQRYPTYYGSAWNALGMTLLTSRSLSAC